MESMVISKYAEPSPCKPDCKNRSAMCHITGECEAFTSWRSRKEEFDRKESNKLNGYRAADEHVADRVYRQIKKDYQIGRSKGWR